MAGQPSFVDLRTVAKEGHPVSIETPGGGPDHVVITPLGSGSEVGRSCVLVQYQGRTIMFDCGIHPAKSGLDALPLFDRAELHTVDLCLVTHFHLDHCGGLPYLCEQTGFRGRVIATHPTKQFYKMVMSDFLRIGAGAQDIVTMEWLHTTMDRIETIEYHQEFCHNGVKVIALNAGHVLGAAMFLVDIAGVRILYTGDFSRVPDRHLLGAELPPVSPDILIVESTYGIQVHETREERERKFTGWVHDIVKRGGRCLIPVFALGRAQELLLVLEEYWAEHKDIQQVPIYYASSLATKCMNLYRTYGSAMNDRVRYQLDNNTNPFEFKYIKSLKDLASFDDAGPSVVLASPGMLQSGVSLELFQRWCGDKKNGLIIAGYCVDGSLAKTVLKNRPKELQREDGSVMHIRMEDIHEVSFSAHSDARQTCDFISHLKETRHVVLVHGNEDSGNKLQKRLTDEFMPRGMTVYTSKNAVPINIPFTVQRTAVFRGSLAAQAAALRNEAIALGERSGLERGLVASDAGIEGVLLVGADRHVSVVAPSDLREFSDLALSAVRHATVIPLPMFVSANEVLRELSTHFSASTFLAASDGRTIGVSMAASGGLKKPRGEVDDIDEDDDDRSTETTKIHVGSSSVVATVRQIGATGRTTVVVTWAASHFADLVADVAVVAIVSLFGNKSSAGSAAFGSGFAAASADQVFKRKCFQRLLCQQFENVTVNLGDGFTTFRLPSDRPYWVAVKNWVDATVHEVRAPLSPDEVDSDAVVLADATADKATAAMIQKVQSVLLRAYFALNPVPEDEPTVGSIGDYIEKSGWCDCNSESVHLQPS